MAVGRFRRLDDADVEAARPGEGHPVAKASKRGVKSRAMLSMVKKRNCGRRREEHHFWIGKRQSRKSIMAPIEEEWAKLLMVARGRR